MYNYSPMGEILLQESTNGSYQLVRKCFWHKLNSLFQVFDYTLSYIYIPFSFEKRVLEIPHTEIGT